jgi:alpha-glucosidase
MNSKSRTIKVPMDFLPEGNYTAEIYTDAPDADENPDHLVKRTETVSQNDVFIFQLAPGGGQVIRLVRQ